MQTHQGRTGWSSWAMFAGFMMILVGIFQQIQGLVAIFNDDWYQVTNKGLVLSVDYTAWGWVHFVLGSDHRDRRCGGVQRQDVGSHPRLCARARQRGHNLMFIAAYPAWSIIVIAIDVLVIYALAMHGDELAERQVAFAPRLDGSGSGSRIMPEGVEQATEAARIGTRSATCNARGRASVLMRMISSWIASG